MLTLKTIINSCIVTGFFFGLAIPQVQADASISTTWASLEGKPVPTGNTSGAQGLVRKFDAPVLGVTRTSRTDS